MTWSQPCTDRPPARYLSPRPGRAHLCKRPSPSRKEHTSDWQLIFDLTPIPGLRITRSPRRRTPAVGIVAAFWYWRTLKTGERPFCLRPRFIAVSILVVEFSFNVGHPSDPGSGQRRVRTQGRGTGSPGTAAGRNVPVPGRQSPCGDRRHVQSGSITVGGGREFEFMAGEYEIAMEQRGLAPVPLTTACAASSGVRPCWGRPKDRQIATFEWSPPICRDSPVSGPEIGTPQGAAASPGTLLLPAWWYARQYGPMRGRGAPRTSGELAIDAGALIPIAPIDVLLEPPETPDPARPPCPAKALALGICSKPSHPFGALARLGSADACITGLRLRNPFRRR